MMNGDFAALLHESVPDIVPVGMGRWRFPLEPGLKRRAGVETAPQWAAFRCPLPRTLAALPFASILRQSAWRGGAKLVWGRARWTLRADVPLLAGTAADRAWLSSQFREVVRGLQAATGHRVPEDAEEIDSRIATDPGTLVDRCRAAGWHAVEKADGEIRVDIESRSVRRVVSIVRQATVMRASVLLGSDELCQASDNSLQAAAIFLLRASSSLRFARAWASGTVGAPSATGFECTIRAAAGDAPLVTAIDALATACDLFGREAEALIGSAAIAGQYLHCFGRLGTDVAEPFVPHRAPAAIAAGSLVASEAVLE